MKDLAEGAALDLLRRLHGAPGDELAYLQFLAALERALSPGARVLHGACASERQPGLLAGPAIGIERLDFGELMTELRHPAAAEYPVGAVLPLLPQSGIFRTRFFAEVLEPAGIRPGPGLVVMLERSARRVEAATIVVPGEPGWAPTPADDALLGKLAPHMVIARRLHASLSVERHDEEALASVFDRLLLGVVLTDVSGNVSYANRSAAELIGHPPGFSERDTILDDYTRAWCERITDRRDGNVFVHAPDDGRLVQVLDAPIDWRGDEPIAAHRFAHGFLIADPKGSAGDPSDVLRANFGLTKSEARLVVALLSDRSLKEAAGDLGVVEATARGVLKSVFAKTGVRRQAELVRLLVQQPTAQLRPHRAVAAGKPTAAGRRRDRPTASRRASS